MLLNSIKINDQEFVELMDIIYRNSGIMFAENKKYLLENRLSKRLADLNFTTFKDYIYYLKYDIKKRQELDILINLVTINETYFLRERGQLDYLVSNIVPDLIKAGKKSIKVWSAPCSTGEEPYSIAILLKNAGLFDKASIDIIATDINSEVVALAKKVNTDRHLLEVFLLILCETLMCRGKAILLKKILKDMSALILVILQLQQLQALLAK